MMTDGARFDMVRAEEFEDNTIGSIDAEAPDFMMLGVRLFAVKRGVKWIRPKQIGLDGSFSLDQFGECCK